MEETEIIEFRWQGAIEQFKPDAISSSQSTEKPVHQSHPTFRRIFTITQQMIDNNILKIPEPVDVEHESFLGERRRRKNENRRRRKLQAAAGRKKAGPPNILVAGGADRYLGTSCSTQRMFIMAFLERNRSHTQ
ncbi:hypothetical protein BIW11_13913, partial [Tropilaelaps mercedesae]